MRSTKKRNRFYISSKHSPFVRWYVKYTFCSECTARPYTFSNEKIPLPYPFKRCVFCKVYKTFLQKHCHINRNVIYSIFAFVIFGLFVQNVISTKCFRRKMSISTKFSSNNAISRIPLQHWICYEKTLYNK